MNAFLQRGENAILLIKHNTDYIHYAFIKKTQVYLKENVLVFNLKRLCLPIKT